MIKTTKTVKMANGTVYTRTVEVYDSCAEYYSRGNYRSLQRKVRKMERLLDEMYRIGEYFDDDFSDIKQYRDLAVMEHMEDEF